MFIECERDDCTRSRGATCFVSSVSSINSSPTSRTKRLARNVCYQHIAPLERNHTPGDQRYKHLTPPE